jgi:hypothetical protein
MKGQNGSVSRRVPQNMAMELLSVDADAHLQKLTAHIFPSPALLPVELVRSALKRRAAAVAVQIHADRITISDNGAGIGSAEWQALACLADMRQTAAAREKAMAVIQNLAHPGIGLLAVFLPGARSLQIENAHRDGKSSLHIANGRSELQNSCSWPQGTRIMISRRRGPAAEEKTLLAELCAGVKTEITINGRQLKRKPLLKGNLASMNIHFGENSSLSSLAVPVHGDVCRIWLLDQGIPWQVTAMAPVLGLVFAAALETDGQLAPPALETLAAAANRLYQWLAENYSIFPEPYQSRIEDLFFKQARSGGDPGLLSLCAPFRLWHSPRRLNLDEVRRKAESGVLVVMDHGSQPSHGSGPERDVLPCEDRPISSARIGGRSVLLLTPRQKDFLGNHLRLPMVILNAQQKTKIRPQKILAFCRRKFLILHRLVATAKAEILDSSRLRREENDLCRELERHWRRKMAAAAPDAAAFPLSVAMVEGRGLVPASWLKNKRGDILRIRRRHPLTLRALRSMSQDHDNSELAFAALMPGYSLTDSNQ